MPSPLPANAQRVISLSPTQFDNEYPGETPFLIQELDLTWRLNAQACYSARVQWDMHYVPSRGDGRVPA